MSRKTFLYCLAIFAFGLAAYANCFSNQFLYDDEHYVQKNPYIRDFSHWKELLTQNVGAGVQRPDNFYRPMQMLAYTAVYQLGGLDVFGFHLLNFLLHIANAFLVYLLVYLLLKNEEAAFAASLLFAVHPIHTEAVTYMNGTADPLGAFFGLLTLLLYLRSSGGKGFYAASLLCLAAALLSKETMVVLPVLIIVLDIFRGESPLRKWKTYVPYFALFGIYMTLRCTVFNFTQSLNLFQESNIYTQNLHYRLFTFLASLGEYYTLLLMPLDLKYDRPLTIFLSPWDPPVLCSMLLLLLLVWLAWRSLRGERVLFLGIAWFFLALGPVSGIIPINGVTMEHWLYFPSIGAFLIVGYLLTKLNRNMSLILLLAAALLLTWRTTIRNRDWSDPITFYTKILQHNPSVARVRNNLAMAYTHEGRPDLAEEQYRMAIALEDRYPETHHNLGLLYANKGMIREAIAEFEKALAINPNFFHSRRVLDEIYRKLDQNPAP